MSDSAEIQKYDTEYKNKRRVEAGLPARDPLYTETEVREAMKLFVPVEYKKKIVINEEITATFYNVGHILGASFIKVSVRENNKITEIVFSGDIGQENSPIVQSPSAVGSADYVFIESTYGDREHPKYKAGQEKLLRVIKDTYKKKGKLMIPSFAIERTQELLYSLKSLFDQKLLPRILIYLDSPMAVEATKVFEKYHNFYDDEAKKKLEKYKSVLVFPKVKYSVSREDSIALNSQKRSCIIIAGSGMCTAGRIKHHIKHNIDNPKNTILFVGYQAPGTLGYWIKSGAKEIRLLSAVLPVRAQVESIDSFSGHADYHGLMAWYRSIKPAPKKVFVTHGDEKPALALSERIKETGADTYVPDMNEKLSI